jgi:hypothetical protein
MANSKQKQEERKFVFTSKNVEEITDQINDGYVIKRYQNPWFKGEIGVRRSGITFAMTQEELQEYIKCKLDIHYFAEHYCRIKREDGSIGKIKLRPYQKDILDLYTKNRFSILMSSRQSGKTINAAITMLHFILFNNDKNIMIVANIASTAIEIIDKIKSIYIQLPFFLKNGIKNWNQRTIIFDNGCRIKSSARSKTPAIGFTIDFLYLDEFAHIPSNIIVPYYTAVYPVVSGIENSKIIITSTPNGMNLFHKLLIDAERTSGDPLKNNYKAMRVYWYEVPGRFVTYYRIYPSKLHEYGLTNDQVLEQAQKTFSNKTNVEIKYNPDLEKWVINVYNNDKCSEEDTRKWKLLDIKGQEIPIQAISDVTTWRDEAVKDIGGEDAFNQEYGLRFINSSKSLLSESVIERLVKEKKEYIWEEIPEFEQFLRFSYHDFKLISDDSIFRPLDRKRAKGIISIDISEGLGQDYSVINLFRLMPKDDELIEVQKHQYTNISDFFSLVQFGIYRSNLVSVKQLAEIFYLIAFVYLNDENFKTVVEINQYGHEFLAHLPHVFDGHNNYGSSVFFRFKHRADAVDEKIGVKINDGNKNLFVKEYQEAMSKKNFVINEENTIREITTFVRQTTTTGAIKFAADVGNDDCVMTLIDASSVFKKTDFIQMCEDYANTELPAHRLSYFNSILREVEYREGADYSALLNVNKHRRLMNQYKDGYRSNYFN